MRIVYRIARTELATLFSSPIPWLVFAVFAWETGTHFATAVRESLGFCLQGIILREGMSDGLIGKVFWGLNDDIYLYVPLLTMGLISREISSGSIKLLYSSPVTPGRIVMGKYLGICLFGGVLIAILLFFGGLSVWLVPAFQWKWWLLAVGGVFLLFCVYAAVGLLVSSLTSYQVIAAIGTLVVLAGLNYVGRLWQRRPTLGAVARFLSARDRFDDFRNGLLDTGNLCYYLVLAAGFLALAVFILEVRRRSKPLWKSLSGFGLVIGVLATVAAVSSMPIETGYYDATTDQRNTVTAPIRSLLSEVRGPFHIHTYVNLLDQTLFMGMPDNHNWDKKLFKPFQRFLNQEIRYDYTYYYDSVSNDNLFDAYPTLSAREVARLQAEGARIDFSHVLTPGQVKQINDLSREEKRFMRVVEYNGRKARLGIFADMKVDPGPDEVAATVGEVVYGPVRVGVTDGHGERNCWGDYVGEPGPELTQKSMRDAMINQGFEFVPLDLAASGIDASLNVILIEGPKSAFSATELVRLGEYLHRGTSFLVMAEWQKQELLEPLINLVGMHFGSDRLTQTHRGLPADYLSGILAAGRDSCSEVGKALTRSHEGLEWPHGIALRYETPLSGETDTLVVARGCREGGDSVGDVPVALEWRRNLGGLDQRVIVAGGADFLAKSDLILPEGKINDWLRNEIFWRLANRAYPFETLFYPRNNPDTSLRVGISGYSWVRLVCTVLFPGLFLLWGLMLLAKRNRK